MTESRVGAFSETAGRPLVEARALVVAYGHGQRRHQVLNGVDLAVESGQLTALVGESGCGKTTLANALLGFLPAGGHIDGGSLSLAGQDVTRATPNEYRRFRGRFVGYVPQDPLTGLNPTMPLGRQVSEAVRRRAGARTLDVRAETIDALAKAGLDTPEKRLKQYPHELSGGMRQRVLIAIALAGRPRIIVADEPTSALDVTVQAKILDHLQEVARESGTALLLITHNLALAADRADKIVVMKEGSLVEVGAPATLIAHPAAQYTRELLAHDPGLTHYSGKGTARREVPADAPEVLRLDRVHKSFRLPDRSGTFKAVDDVSLAVREGQTVGVVGESGSGKSTLLRIAMGLTPADEGEVEVLGHKIGPGARSGLRAARAGFQLVQQDPFASLDPRFTIERVIAEPLVAHRASDRKARRQRVGELLDAVGLPDATRSRRPRELSGGQRQRVAIARALALRPRLVLLDEPVSALDVSVQHQVLELLEQLQRDFTLSYVLVSHDLAAVAAFSDTVVVLEKGRVVERGDARQVVREPRTDYGRQLAAAIPGRRAAGYLTDGRPAPADWPAPSAAPASSSGDGRRDQSLASVANNHAPTLSTHGSGTLTSGNAAIGAS
ncbi:MAG: ABC transporter ATP-binding protein [Bifidobacteriaceae bacterium]|jgi:peptide/nickel transport system ATP-binding protein|nr:ABC transporter ATP-binding protein [Bifidobacteriaceae bacterium]